MRINPDELHVKDPTWIETLYPSGGAVTLYGDKTFFHVDSYQGIRDKYPPAALMAGTPLGSKYACSL